MVDREKIIKGLECCSKGCSRNCPYFETEGCTALLANDALAMLKDQEAKPTPTAGTNKIPLKW